MAVKVLKFGGSVIPDAAGIQNAAEIIAAEIDAGNKVVAVVSAMGDTTDSLIAESKSISQNPQKRELDMLMSAGEQISVSLLCMALGGLGKNAVSLLGWQAGILTSASFGEARIKDIDTARIQKELAGGRAVTVAGFQGVTKQGDMTTLGRGGSDTTAVALAAKLRAERVIIYSTSDSIYTADPSLLPDAKPIKEISYDAMQELSYLGAQVLNPRAVELARKYDVTIEVRSPFSLGGGTLIKENAKMENMLISGVTRMSNIAQITIRRLEDRPGAANNIFAALTDSGIYPDMILQSADRNGTIDVAFTVRDGEAETAISALKKADIKAADIECDKGVAKVSVVGAGMQSHPGAAAAVFKALADAGINIRMISSSEMRFSVVVNHDASEAAVKAIHAKFIS